MLNGVYSDDETEFFRHVYNPLQDPTFLAGQSMHSSINFQPLEELIESIFGNGGQTTFADESSAVDNMRRALVNDPEPLDTLRLLVGRTKTKLSIDLSLSFRGTESPAGDPSLCGCSMDGFTRHQYSYFKNFLSGNRRSNSEVQKAGETIANYFANIGVIDVLGDFASMSTSARQNIIEEAIVPHDGRQSRAKRQGHGAEAEIARVIEAIGANIRPANKVSHPMEGDVDFEDYSYDLLVDDDNGNTRAGLISLFHTSNPGQFGVDKTAKTANYLQSIESYNKTVSNGEDCELWSFCDGAGFAMNNKALRNVLGSVDDWVQIKSVWKLALSLNRRDICNVEAIAFNQDFYSDDELDQLERSLSSVDVVNEGRVDSSLREVEAGEAVLYV
ncbi:hypothetical protein G9C85_17995 [Halorubellus sp. JP-L1]|uniref:hypothetical protein n=1 Tax=Halorubellus sp. JP-L1 TaxID=2715753 RepID=UPI00140A4011|nr:hypothetical protein [Halorubellus sp. JP-L1]NHN43514.1 hypothetical protein [Halorubellus sp. JP-L1]